jgi:hypothetical protein
MKTNHNFAAGPWTKEEDEHVIELVRKYGPKRWTLVRILAISISAD